MKRHLLLLTVVAALIVASRVNQSLGGTIGVNGTWATAVGQGNGPITDANTNHPIVGDAVDDPGASSNAADGEMFHSPFQSITLANAGDRIDFTGTMLLQGSINSVASSATPRTQFRFGLFQDNGSAGNTGWLGYLSTNTHGNGTPAGSISRKNTGNTSTYLSTTGATSLTSSNGNGSVFNDDTYALVMSVERQANGDLAISASITGTAATNFSESLSVTATAATVVTYTFDRLGFLLGGNLDTDRAAFSDLQVSSNLIPEPTSVALLVLSTIWGVFVRRRAR